MGQENTLCPICERKTDTQAHILDCEVMQSILPDLNKHIKYEHINGSLDQQVQLVQVYEKYLELRETLLEEEDDHQGSLPGLHAGPVLPKANTRGGN